MRRSTPKITNRLLAYIAAGVPIQFAFPKYYFKTLTRSIFKELSLIWIKFAPCIGNLTGYLTSTSKFAGQGFNRMCQPCNIVGFGKAMIAGLRERNNNILAQQSIDNF